MNVNVIAAHIIESNLGNFLSVVLKVDAIVFKTYKVLKIIVQ